MGLIANVYRTGKLIVSDQESNPKNMEIRDCTLNGWSSRYDRVCIVNVSGPFEPSENCPAVLIRRHRTMPALHVVAVSDFEANKWTMMGGNFLHSSDSRFSETCNDIMVYGNNWPQRVAGTLYNVPAHMSFHAIPIHDRIEK